ncbi:hypothetical protein U8593_00840 [Aquirufa antheringensis]
MNDSKKIKLLECEVKWEGRYILLMSLFGFLGWLGINQIWIYFVGESIPFILVLFLMVHIWYRYMSEKQNDLKREIDRYHQSFNSEFSGQLRGLFKDVPGMHEVQFKLTDKQIEEQYIPRDIIIYGLKGNVIGIILFIFFLIFYFKPTSSVF